MDRVVKKTLFGIMSLPLGMQVSAFVHSIPVGDIGIGIWELVFFGWDKGPHPPKLKLATQTAKPHHPGIFHLPAIAKPLFASPSL